VKKERFASVYKAQSRGNLGVGIFARRHIHRNELVLEIPYACNIQLGEQELTREQSAQLAGAGSELFDTYGYQVGANRFRGPIDARLLEQDLSYFHESLLRAERLA
jgi:c-di-GMP-binding flagellar brake protein YcgR